MMHNGMRKHAATPEVSPAKTRLGKVFENKQYKGAPMEYEYDFGDCWVHKIKIVGRADASDRFVCLEGAGHGVAEDAGSTSGWEALKKAYRTTTPTKEQREKRAWFEKQASNRDPRGLANGRDRIWDMVGVNVALARI